MANLDPRGMVGRIYVETTKYCYILNLLNLGLLASKKKIFEIDLYKQMNRWGMISFDPKGFICRIYVGDH